MRRVFFHYRDMEECRPDGMWRIVAGVDERERFTVAAEELMRDVDRFRDSMLTVVTTWPNSCAANMTTPSLNRRAWFGHAGCFVETGSPEDCTRLGWHRLDDLEQRRANAAADDAIAEWHRSYVPLGAATLWEEISA